MKRLLRAMWYALLPIIAIIAIVAIVQVIVCCLKALELDPRLFLMLAMLILAYVLGVFIYYDND